MRGGPGCEPAAPDLSIIYGFDFVGKTRGEAARAPDRLRREGLGASSGAAAWPCLPQRARVLTEELRGRTEPLMGQPKLSLPRVRLGPFSLQRRWPLMEESSEGFPLCSRALPAVRAVTTKAGISPPFQELFPRCSVLPCGPVGVKAFLLSAGAGFSYVCDCSLDS